MHLPISNVFFLCPAYELRSWLLYYSPVVLHGILDDVYYQHHLILVQAIYLLLKDVIKKAEQEKSMQLLQYYCYLFSSLYGRYSEFCSFYLMASILFGAHACIVKKLIIMSDLNMHAASSTSDYNYAV